MKLSYQTPKTPHMKQFLICALTLFIFSSCKKDNGTEPLDPTKAYTIKYEVGDQNVKTRVGNDTLYLDYYQVVNFLLDPKEASNSWALMLKQDFSKSYLNGLHFTALASTQGNATDWVPINLNDVHPTQKTTTNVTVNGTQYVRVTLSRVFNFHSKLNTPQAAIDKQNALLQTSTDVVSFDAFYSYGNVYSLANTTTAKLAYTKP